MDADRVARTDDDRARSTPLRIMLGGEPRSIRPLVLKKSRDWKKAVAATFSELSGLTFEDVSQDGKLQSDALKQALESMAVMVPEKLEALVFAYLRLADPALDMAALEDLVTDQEITDALWTMVQATFPFLWKVGDLVKLANALGR